MTISRGNKIILKGHKQNNDIYILDMKVNSLRIDAGIQVNAAEVQARLWHERLGDVNLKTIRCMIKKNRIDGIQLNGNMFPDDECKACKLGKAHRIPYKNIIFINKDFLIKWVNFFTQTCVDRCRSPHWEVHVTF